MYPGPVRSWACRATRFTAIEMRSRRALLERPRRSPNLKNRVDIETENTVVAYAVECPAHGQVRVSNELRKRGVFVSASGVRSIWMRHDLANFKTRLKALEAKVAEDGIILTEAQVQALEKKKLDDEAWGEIETAHPGYLGSQDTFYVGTLKGVGRIYQQTYIDTYAKIAQAKLYKTKTPITAADMLNDKVLPFHEEHGLPVLRILTDRGTEYCGRADRHDYQLFLAINDIEHTRTKVKSPQTNGICERFHKTILQEFYQVAFRKPSSSCKSISTFGSITTTMNAPIRAKSAKAGRPCRPCSTAKLSGRKSL